VRRLSPLAAWRSWISEPWLRPALLCCLASFVETLGFGHLGSFTPLYLEQFGIPTEAVPQWVGLLTAVSFVLGLPLAPLWGVWADRYSRKLIIVRSTVGEGLIFFLFGIADAPWQLIVARMLVGFILGNTGVMYALLSDVTPRRQLATAIAFISAGSTLGVSVGPFVGGWLVTWIGFERLFQLDAVICWAVALLLIVGLRDTRASDRPRASTLELLQALPGSLRASPVVLPLFGIYFIALLGMNMHAPFVPLLVAEVYRGAQLPVAIGTLALITGVISALCGPFVGRLGGRYGHRPVLAACVGIACIAVAVQTFVGDYTALVVARSVLGAVAGGLSPLIVSVIALATPEAQRASVLSLTLFPGNLSFLIGGVGGSAIAALGIRAVFAASAGILAVTSVVTLVAGRLGGRPTPQAEKAR